MPAPAVDDVPANLPALYSGPPKRGAYGHGVAWLARLVAGDAVGRGAGATDASNRGGGPQEKRESPRVEGQAEPQETAASMLVLTVPASSLQWGDALQAALGDVGRGTTDWVEIGCRVLTARRVSRLELAV